jgi:enoyl-CoA hydratase
MTLTRGGDTMPDQSTRRFARWSQEACVATLIVERPPLNALSYQTKEEIGACLEEIAADPAVRCLIVYGAGGRAFSVGSDIKEFPEVSARRLGHARAVHEHALNNRIDFFPVPTIAAIEGHCLGGGLELALACDWIYATREARFGQTEARLGFVSGWGGAHRLARRVGAARAREMFFTARVIDAADAERVGLVNFAGDARAVEDRLAATLEEIAATSRGSVARLKGILNGDRESGLASAMRETVASQLAIADPETLARVRAFLEGKR